MDFFKYIVTGFITICKITINLFKYFFIGIYNIITLFPKYFINGIMIIFKKKEDKPKINKANSKYSFAIIGLSLIIYLSCVFLISKWSVQELKIKYLSNDIVEKTEIIEKEEKNDSVETNDNSSDDKKTYYPDDYWDYMNVPFMEVNFDELLKKNSDTVGWIKIDGTKVNYPVVQSDDNNYYLNHSFKKTSNIAGWVYADYRVDFKNFGKNTIIYGHNMNNKTMFGSVPSMLYDGYLRNSKDKYIKISTPTCNTVWKVFSIYTVEPEVYYLKTNFKTEPYDQFLNKIKGRSIYNFGVDVNTNDKVLTLSTCDNTGTKRIAVHAKMINIEYK